MYFNIMIFKNSNIFYLNKKIQDYLKDYQGKFIEYHTKKYNKQKDISYSLIQPIPPVDPKNYFIPTITYVFSFLAGYYYHYFLKM
jgi:hypothetical protein